MHDKNQGGQMRLTPYLQSYNSTICCYVLFIRFKGGSGPKILKTHFRDNR